MTQKLVFGEYDNFGNPEQGPFFWSAADREKYRYDIVDGEKEIKMTVPDLQAALKAKGINWKGKREMLVKRCENHVPPIPT